MVNVLLTSGINYVFRFDVNQCAKSRMGHAGPGKGVLIMRSENRRTWIVVADGGHARILLNTSHDRGVTELALASKGEPRLAHHRTEQAAGVHHTPVFKPTQERRNEDEFLYTLAETIQTGVARKECDQVVLVCPATAMGIMRNALSSETRKHIVAEVVHDYTHQTNDFVYDKVKDKLPL
jgi:protein required for attachment to host cells